jgi:hypothetical protein
MSKGRIHSHSENTPRRQIVVLVGEASGATFNFDSKKRGICFAHVNNVFMNDLLARPVDDIADVEDPRSNHLSPFDSTTFNETINVIRARAIK